MIWLLRASEKEDIKRMKLPVFRICGKKKVHRTDVTLEMIKLMERGRNMDFWNFFFPILKIHKSPATEHLFGLTK